MLILQIIMFINSLTIPAHPVETFAEEPIWILVIPVLKKDFVDKYKYEDNCNYKVALNIDWYYYNTYRNEIWWVYNDKKLWLTGWMWFCEIAYNAERWTREWIWWRTIYFWKNKFAKKNWEYWYFSKELVKKEISEYKIYVSWVGQSVDFIDLYTYYVY